MKPNHLVSGFLQKLACHGNMHEGQNKCSHVSAFAPCPLLLKCCTEDTHRCYRNWRNLKEIIRWCLLLFHRWRHSNRKVKCPVQHSRSNRTNGIQAFCLWSTLRPICIYLNHIFFWLSGTLNTKYVGGHSLFYHLLGKKISPYNIAVKS